MEKSVVLRRSQDADGVRHLSAAVAANGDVSIAGQDLGPAVERFFGQGLTEYEYTLTIRAAAVPTLLAALGAKDDVLSALQQHFKNPAAADPRSFLTEHGILYEFWSRLGD